MASCSPHGLALKLTASTVDVLMLTVSSCGVTLFTCGVIPNWAYMFNIWSQYFQVQLQYSITILSGKLLSGD